MPALEFVGQSSQDPDNTPANPSRLLNCYREAVNGRTAHVIKAVLGQSATPFCSLGSVTLRALVSIEDYVYAALGGNLYRIASDGTSKLLGEIGDSVDTSISSNNSKVTVVANGRYFVWDGSTLTEPTTGAFDAFGDVAFFRQLTVLSERNGRTLQWSGVADATTLDGLAFATAEYGDGPVLRIMPYNGELWVFKESIIQRFYGTGSGLANVPAGEKEYGLKDRQLLTRIGEMLFFVGSDNKVYLAMGLEFLAISTAAVGTSISTQNPERCFSYRDEGHDFCVITFPNRPAWVFDISMKEWHERGDGESLGAWTAKEAVEAFGGHYVGDDLGQIWLLDRVSTDRGLPLVMQMTSRTLILEGDGFRIPKIEFKARVGANGITDVYDASPDILGAAAGSLDANDGTLKVADAKGARTPILEMEYSDDDGNTWRGRREMSMGARGRHNTKLIARSLGFFETLVVRLTFSEDIDAPIDATAFVRVA